MDLETSKSGIKRENRRERFLSRSTTTKRKRQQRHLRVDSDPVRPDSGHLKKSLIEGRMKSKGSVPQHGRLSLSNPTGTPVTGKQQQQQQQQQPYQQQLVRPGDEGQGIEESPQWWSIKDRGVHFWKRWCDQEGFQDGDKVTNRKLMSYTREFVVPMELVMNELGAKNTRKMTKLSGMRVFLEPVHELWKDQQIEQDRNMQQQPQQAPLQALENNVEKVTLSSTPILAPTLSKAVLLNSARFQQQQQQQQSKSNARQQVQRLEQSGRPIRFNAQEFVVPIRKKGPWPGTLAASRVSTYVLNRNVTTVRDVLAEWRYGVEGGPAIQDLQSTTSRRDWGVDRDGYEYTVRAAIVEEFVRAVMEDGQSEEEAIETLEALRKRRLSSIYGAILGRVRSPT